MIMGLMMRKKPCVYIHLELKSQACRTLDANNLEWPLRFQVLLRSPHSYWHIDRMRDKLQEVQRDSLQEV